MYEKTVVVGLTQGLHARPASEFVQKAGQFNSKVFVVKADKAADAKSILGLMGLAVSHGAEVTVRAEGMDEVAAVDTLCDLIEQPE